MLRFCPFSLSCGYDVCYCAFLGYLPLLSSFRVVLDFTVGLLALWFFAFVRFGVMFAAAFPLAPMIVFVNCLFESKLDAAKLFTVFRRPAPMGAEDIGECSRTRMVPAWRGSGSSVQTRQTFLSVLEVLFVSDSCTLLSRWSVCTPCNSQIAPVSVDVWLLVVTLRVLTELLTPNAVRTRLLVCVL